MRSISIIHPSRNRPKQAALTARKWLSSAKNRGNIQYLLSVDIDDDRAAYAFEFGKEEFVSYSNFEVIRSANKTAIEAINTAARVSKGDIIIVVSDDFDCPFHWDVALLDAIGDKTDIIIKTDDLATNNQGRPQHQPWIITLPIMDRAYYNRFGYIYYPEYRHMFCDTEMTHVADLLDRKITLPIRFPHNHYTTGKMAKDEVSVKNDKTWAQGEALYLKRVKENFGLVGNTGVLRCDQSHYNWLQSKGIKLEAA